MPRLLIIVYYFPPRKNSGTLRVKRLTKYLPEFEWQVKVLPAKLSYRLEEYRRITIQYRCCRYQRGLKPLLDSPLFGIAGAAWATSISYTFAFIVISIVYSKISGNNIWNVVLPHRSDFYFYKDLVGKNNGGNIR